MAPVNYRSDAEMTWREDTNIGAKNESLGCQFCPRKFPTKTKAARHEESHDLIRRWGCRHCAKQYKDKYDVKKHLCSAHGHNNENWEEGARYIGTDIEPPMIGPVKTRRPRKALAPLALNATLDSCSKNNSSFVVNAPANQFGFSNSSNQQSSSGPFLEEAGQLVLSRAQVEVQVADLDAAPSVAAASEPLGQLHSVAAQLSAHPLLVQVASLEAAPSVAAASVPLAQLPVEVMIFSKLILPLSAFALETATGAANFVEEYVEIYSLCAETELGFHQETDEMSQELMAHIGDACDNFTRTYICMDYQPPEGFSDLKKPEKRASFPENTPNFFV
ncbi:Oidioi.mRNA.OKI2018_I69.chr1.g1176.t1.cds [Oikopleura dioica]|uniref:Oidioi.mRNA.OKI2018_I69.chr1.g1176.t1.cds n=1 Tax=Oikopleura dioica TaxID=34765 RepID=A0ABN7SM49_OIKDI|nr:Oidioi.mRNA.OKI2018_I69.chr1.g1176.t1.cds [Oikopleura dioica]